MVKGVRTHSARLNDERLDIASLYLHLHLNVLVRVQNALWIEKILDLLHVLDTLGVFEYPIFVAFISPNPCSALTEPLTSLVHS